MSRNKGSSKASTKEWIYGIHTVSELLRRHPHDILELWIQQGRADERIEELESLADAVGIQWQNAEKRTLDRKLGDERAVHQGVLAWCRISAGGQSESALYGMLEALERPALLLVLDEISDPHNLGACLRSADAAGADAVIVPKTKSAPLNMTVRKVASGAAESVNFIAVTNLSRTLAELRKRGIWIIGAAGEADETLYEMNFRDPAAIVMGSEGRGLRRLTREHCDFLMSIPMAGSVSSLNVSVATGITLFEAVRQRSR